MNTPKAPAGYFTILYFANASSYVNKPSGGHDFLQAPVRAIDLYDLLDRKYPGIKAKVLDGCLLNVDDEYVDMEEESTKAENGLQIAEGSTVVIVPPVSAG